MQSETNEEQGSKDSIFSVFLKTPIGSVGFSTRTENALANAGIRTIGGILRKKRIPLSNIKGLGVVGLAEIEEKLAGEFPKTPEDKGKKTHLESSPTTTMKTPVELFGFSARTRNALSRGRIRTIAGLIRRKISDLLEIRGMGVKSIEEIKEKLNNSVGVSNENQEPALPSLDVPLPSIDTFGIHNGLKFNSKDDIVDMLAARFGVDREDIEGPSRRKELVVVRDLVAYFLRRYAEMSYPAIGRLLGGRDHTTIIHSYKKIQNSLDEEKDFESKFAELVAKARAIKERKLHIEQRIIPEIITHVRSQVLLLRSRPKFKEISNRDLKILELYREGLTLENIGKAIGVTRERIRQVVEKTVRQFAINESVTRDITMDADILLQEEKKKRSEAQKKAAVVQSSKKEDRRWSRYYIACRTCGTTAIPHVRKGLCEQCVGQFRADRRETIISEHHARCDSCGKTRPEALALYGRDLYITKDRRVLCKACFRQFSGKKLGGYKNFEWSRFYQSCISCETTSIPHHKKGLCEKCGNKITDKEREARVNRGCNYCGLTRMEAKNKFGRDLYITKDGSVSCMGCF